MKQALSFFGTKIGVSIIAFVLIVTGALIVKHRSSAPADSTKSAVDLAVGQIAKQILNRATESGAYKSWDQVNGTSTIATSTGSAVPKPNYTSTDLFSQEIFKQYLAVKQSGGTIDASTSDAIAQNVLSKSYPTDASAQTNAIGDIKTIDSSYINLVSYGNTLARKLSAPLPKGYTKSEIDLLQDIANDPNLLGTIDFKPFLDRYTTMRDGLLAMKVPGVVAKSHLAIINGVNDLIFAVQGMMTLESDPIGGMGKTAFYDTGLGLIDVSFTEIKSIYKDRGVSYSTNEAAYPFFN